ncbi:MAG: hypothetical protein FWB96_05205 [Defluviitaleaceae bacterium]|nr:hypothetical protein [Defluviitaleaceae bacterium]MCL2263618.1 hypothetical protein [Defluviitaleaceae bacterium]
MSVIQWLRVRYEKLAEPPESIVVMDTQNIPSIVWCDAVEVSKLDNKSFISSPDEWSTFTDYFAERLATAEEEMICMKQLHK